MAKKLYCVVTVRLLIKVWYHQTKTMGPLGTGIDIST